MARKKYTVTVGQRLGLWVVLGEPTGGSHPKVHCRCDCGKEKLVDVRSMVKAMSTNCGCRKGRLSAERFTKHGMTNSTEYAIWSSMKARCCLPANHAYHWYGGRGIRVCDRWMNSFEAFLEDMGRRPDGLTLDRENVNGDYCKENCRWATPKNQARNTRSNRVIEIDGESRCLAEWCEYMGISRQTVTSRLRYGWDETTAIITPARKLTEGRTGTVIRGESWKAAKASARGTPGQSA